MRNCGKGRSGPRGEPAPFSRSLGGHSSVECALWLSQEIRSMEDRAVWWKVGWYPDPSTPALRESSDLRRARVARVRSGRS